MNDYDTTQVDEWLRNNVISKLLMSPPAEGEQEYYTKSLTLTGMGKSNIQMRGNKTEVAKELTEWLEHFGDVEMWSDCLSYDWVLFNQLFGHAFNIPKNVYYIPFDLCTLLKLSDIDPDVSREAYSRLIFPSPLELNKHNALHDAVIIKACYEQAISGAKE